MASYLGRLTSRGFFPKELPPCFNTVEFQKAVMRAKYNPVFVYPKNTSAELAIHSLSRSPIRRMLGIPNPIYFLPLAKTISANWKALSTKTTSPYGISTPHMESKIGRAVSPRTGFNWRGDVTLMRRKHARYSVTTDIAECYKSFYTHSIPWAVHGKVFSKNNKHSNNLGNALDRHLRNCQSAQTNGFPVGPDTSFVLSELILSAIDREIDNTLEDAGIRLIGGIRFFDDYEFMTSSLNEAEIALRVAQKVFLDFGLHPQGSKTFIRDLPQPTIDSWPAKIRKHPLRNGWKAQRHDLLELHDLAASLAHDTHESVFAYAVMRLAKSNIQTSNESLALQICIQATQRDTSSLPHLAQFLVNLVKKGTQISHFVDDLQAFLVEVIKRHAPLNHGFEVTWALWLALTFKIDLRDVSLDQELKLIDDPFAAILVAHAFRRKLVSLDPSIWDHRMNEADLYGSWWPFVYEMWARDWLTSPQLAKLDQVSSPNNFAYLKQNGVKFYRDIQKPRKTPIVTVDWSEGY
jgi:hypothetical protein